MSIRRIDTVAAWGQLPLMGTRSTQLQIRITPAEKAELKRRAARAGQDVSSYVLSRALPSAAVAFAGIVEALRAGAGRGYVLAELNDLLSGLSPAEFPAAVSGADVAALPPFEANYAAAMVEQAAYMKGVAPPEWTVRVTPLEEPYFATALESLREHLLRSSPVAFRRRNLFVDATVGDRV